MDSLALGGNFEPKVEVELSDFPDTIDVPPVERDRIVDADIDLEAEVRSSFDELLPESSSASDDDGDDCAMPMLSYCRLCYRNYATGMF